MMSDGSAESTLEAHDGGTGQQVAAPAIAEIARSLASTLEVGAIMQRVTDCALKLTQASGAYVERIVAGGEDVEVVATSGTGAPPRGTRVPYAESLTRAAWEEEIPDRHGPKRDRGATPASCVVEEQGGDDSLVVSLISEEAVLGALVLLRDPGSTPLLADEVAEVRTLGDLASLSLRRVLLLEKVEQERTQLAALLESTGEGIYGIDREGRCTFINPAAARMLGYTPEECLGRDMHALIHHHHLNGSPYLREKCPIFQVSRDGNSVRVDDEVLWRKDGTPFPAEYSSFPIRQGARITGAVVTFLDITEWKRVEAAEHRYTEQLRGLAESALAINSAPTVDEALRVITEQARTVVGAHQSSVSVVQDGDWSRAISVVSLSDTYAAWKDCDARPDASEIYRLVGGVNRPLRMTQEQLEAHPAWHGFAEHADRYPPMRGWLAVPLVARDGTNIGLIQLSDRYRGEFTEQDEAVLLQFARMAAVAIENVRLYEEAQEARRAAEAAQAAAEAAARAKSEFLSIMSHEIRTPINAIVGYADLLELGIAGPITEAQQSQLDRIQDSGQHLLGLVDDILDLTRVETGRMSVDRERARAEHAITAALALVEPQAIQKRITIRNRCAGESDTSYIGDEDRVRQILVNLLSNAVKFTGPGGEIRVSCGLTRESAPGAKLPERESRTYIRVQDTGIGIAPDKLEEVFHPFTQVEQGHTRTQGGTGLGLTISHHLARLMGGDLTVESEPGVGSTFTLWLPSEASGAASLEDAVREETGKISPRGLATVGKALQEEIETMLGRYRSRLRSDPRVPMAAELDEADLEDHSAAFVADLAQSLIALEKSSSEPERLLHDGSEIQRVISELHGRQRAQLGWTAEALGREFEILREEVQAGVRRAAPEEADLDGALRLLTRFMERAERISLRSLYRASGH